jgi:hypothetical protein
MHSTQAVIEQLQTHRDQIASGSDPVVQPGRPERLNEAARAGDAIAQGDLLLMVVDLESVQDTSAIPADQVRPSMVQLVPGNSEGARHCLDSLEGVTFYQTRPGRWFMDVNDPLAIFHCSQERTVLHPVHGPVIIAAGHTIAAYQQRELVNGREQRMVD